MFKVKITILLISILVVSTKCDDESTIIVKAIDEPKICTVRGPHTLPDFLFTHLSVVDNLGRCFNRIENITVNDFKILIEEAETEENVNEIVKNACLKKDNIYNCVEQRYRLSDECTPAEILELRNSLLLHARGILTHLCDDDGLRLRNFFNDKGINCFTEKTESLKNCSTLLTEQIRGTKTAAEKCDGLKTAQTCTVEVLQTCETQGAALFIDELVDLVLDEHVCKNKEIQTGEQNTE